jgi:hypothetical protein
VDLCHSYLHAVWYMAFVAVYLVVLYFQASCCGGRPFVCCFGERALSHAALADALRRGGVRLCASRRIGPGEAVGLDHRHTPRRKAQGPRRHPSAQRQPLRAACGAHRQPLPAHPDSFLPNQATSFQASTVVATLKGALLDDPTANKLTFSSPDQVLAYIGNRAVAPVFTDPVCGDGRCEAPWEFPAWGPFGCRADCGVQPNTTAVLVAVTGDFMGHESLSPRMLMEHVRWNLCLDDAERRKRGQTDLCWWAAARGRVAGGCLGKVVACVWWWVICWRRSLQREQALLLLPLYAILYMSPLCRPPTARRPGLRTTRRLPSTRRPRSRRSTWSQAPGTCASSGTLPAA